MFIDSFRNRKLRRLRKAWRKGNLSGPYLLVGPTGCGKTAFLNSVFDESANIVRFLGRDISDMIVESIRFGTAIESPRQSIVFIENIDATMRSDMTMKVAMDLLRDWSGGRKANKKLIICTAESADAIRSIEWFKVVKIRPIKVTRKVVRTMAQSKSISLTSKQVGQLVKCVSMSELNESLNRTKLLNEIESSPELRDYFMDGMK